MTDLGSGSGKREGRSITRLSGLTAGRIAKERTPVEVDPRSGKALSPNATKFRSYLGVLARRHVSIIIPSWDDVEEADKNLMWQDIQAKRVASQERQSKNDASHLLSRRGYELKKKKLMKAEGLVEQTTQGSFIPHGRDDILTTAIGRPKHAGRVRGIGGSWSHQDYFDAPPSRNNIVDSCSQEAMQRIEMQFEEKLKNIREDFEQKFELLTRSQQQTVVAHDGVRVSTKESCAALDPSGEQTHIDVPNQCELYVEDDPPRLVTIGRVFEGGSTDDPISRLLTILPQLKKKPIQLQWDIRVFGVDSSNVPLYISLPDALEIIEGNSMLNISIIQLWAMYMDKLSVEQAQAQVYGFIEPQSIQKSGNTQVQIQQYMQTWMSESRRDIYMAPYVDRSHWQLMVIIPKEYTVVWFCSIHRKPSHEIKCQLQG
uniref:Ubiquitin-like protease family profile domain-containing protein n=1 Tax=Cajanus cajan TaxID=3821 RepID=A0A151U3E5_CAJCA|nr:hypothetical protein KK1_006462 [Cajanus cajan]